jgi:DNA ligase-1
LDDAPVGFLAYDLLEDAGLDIRSWPLERRRARLEEIVVPAAKLSALQLAPLLDAGAWEAVVEHWATARERGAAGLVLKRRGAPYHAGRLHGDWWAWPVAPYTASAVLIYAQRGIGRYAGLYSDYTFGVWDGDALVPFAKTADGMSDAEIRKVDAFVRRNGVEKFGPVRTVKPALVFELAFEGVERSARTKSGLAVRRPWVLRRRADQSIQDAARLETIRRLLVES